MPRRNVLSSPRLSELKKGRRWAVLNKFLIFILVMAAAVALLSYISRLNGLNINEVQISGNQVLDEDILKASIQEQLAGKYLWLFPKTNVLYYPKNTITRVLQNKFQRIKDINLSAKDNEILSVTVNERIGKYMWCGVSIPEDNTDPKCYFMDSDGYVFDEAPYFSSGVYFEFYGNSDFNAENPFGSYFLKDKFPKIITFKNTVEELGFKPTAFSIDDNGDANFYLSKDLPTSSKMIFKLDSDLEKTAENLQAALATEPLKSKLRNNFSTLQYIDLRFGNKVYNKFSAQGGPASGGQ